ncbi:MAG: hypothetical protein JW909_05585 [Planctomycetes bacterium]|nr:hypothetical protein [Planctomycetota bacterium]
MTSRRKGVAGLLRGEEGGAGVVIVMLLIIVALGALSYMGYAKAKQAEVDMKAAQDKVAQLEKDLKVATAKPAVAPAKDPAGGGDVAAQKKLDLANATVAELKDRVQQLADEKADLEEKLDGADAALQEAKDAASALQDKLDENADAAAEVDDLKASAEASKKAAEEALGKLDAAEGAAEDLKLELKKVKDESQVLAARLVEQLDERDQKIGMLLARLKEYPVLPLDEATAKEKYDKVMQIAEQIEDRDEKIALYFKGGQLLLGTTYEAKVKRLLDTEMRAKQAALDAAGVALYKEARTMLKKSPKAYDENVQFLEDALEKARGSRYEKQIEDMLKSQKDAAEAARKAAEEEAAKKAAEEEAVEAAAEEDAGEEAEEAGEAE